MKKWMKSLVGFTLVMILFVPGTIVWAVRVCAQWVEERLHEGLDILENWYL